MRKSAYTPQNYGSFHNDAHDSFMGLAAPTENTLTIDPPGALVTKSVYVEDTDTGKPLSNVNVYLKNDPNTGAITNAEGIVTLTAPQNAVVVFSHVGYTPRERVFGDIGGLQNLDKQTTTLPAATVIGAKKTNWLLIGGGLLLLWGISAIASKGKTGKTGLNGPKNKNKGKKKKKKKVVTV